MITKQDIANVREQMQEDLITILDDLPSKLIDEACQIIVDGMKKLEEKS